MSNPRKARIQAPATTFAEASDPDRAERPEAEQGALSPAIASALAETEAAEQKEEQAFLLSARAALAGGAELPGMSIAHMGYVRFAHVGTAIVGRIITRGVARSAFNDAGQPFVVVNGECFYPADVTNAAGKVTRKAGWHKGAFALPLLAGLSLAEDHRGPIAVRYEGTDGQRKSFKCTIPDWR